MATLHVLSVYSRNITAKGMLFENIKGNDDSGY